MSEEYTASKKRIGIFYLGSPKGTLDKSAQFYLEQIKPFLSGLFVVCQREPDAQSAGWLTQNVNTWQTLSAPGNRFSAYRKGLKSIGKQAVCECDELLLFDDSVFGPLFPLEELFETMDKETADFWGAACQTLSPSSEGTPYLAPSFLAIRRPVLLCEAFFPFWENSKLALNSPNTSVIRDALFTQHFSQMGFSWVSYCKTSFETPPFAFWNRAAFKKERCPLLSKDAFLASPEQLLSGSAAGEGAELLSCIKECTDYDPGLILDSLLQNQNQADLKNNLHFNYILPTKPMQNPGGQISGKTALFITLFHEENIDLCAHYAASMPEDSHIIIQHGGTAGEEAIQSWFSNIPCGKLELLPVANLSEQNNRPLAGFRAYVTQYDQVCFVHDEQEGPGPSKPGSPLQLYQRFEGVLKTPGYVQNILATLEQNPFLGLLSPPAEIQGEHFSFVGHEWGEDFDACANLAETLGLSADIQPGKSPVMAVGTGFWFRPKALEPLFWAQDSYTIPPTLYSFIVQSQGYVPAWVMPDTLAAMEISHLYSALQELNCTANPKGAPPNEKLTFSHLLQRLREPQDFIAARDEQVFQITDQVEQARQHTEWLKEKLDARETETQTQRQLFETKSQQVQWLNQSVNMEENLSWARQQLQVQNSEIQRLRHSPPTMEQVNLSGMGWGARLKFCLRLLVPSRVYHRIHNRRAN